MEEQNNVLNVEENQEVLNNEEVVENNEVDAKSNVKNIVAKVAIGVGGFITGALVRPVIDKAANSFKKWNEERKQKKMLEEDQEKSSKKK